MKKILFVILAIVTMFTLVACKKSEPVGRTTDNFLTDFKLEQQYEYDQYDAMIKEQSAVNRLNKFRNAGQMLRFSFTNNKKVVLKKINFRLYNYSETETLRIFTLTKDYYNYIESENYLNINRAYESLDSNYKWVDLNPNCYTDVSITLDNCIVKKNTKITLFFGFTIGSEAYDIDPSNADISERMKPLELMKTCGGVCNFNLEYMAYIKI